MRRRLICYLGTTLLACGAETSPQSEIPNAQEVSQESTPVAPLIHIEFALTPPEVSETRDAQFEFVATDGSPCACRIDNEPFAPCESPVQLSALLRGTHRFEVQPAGGGETIAHDWRIVQNEGFPELVVLEADPKIFPDLGNGVRAVEHAWLTRQLAPLYAEYPDAFHSVALYTTFPLQSAVFGQIVQFDVGGIGLERRGLASDTSRVDQSGSSGLLEHVLFMGQLDMWDDDPEQGQYRRAVDILAQEFAHRWLSYLLLPSRLGWPYALGDSSDAHWNMFVDLGPSPMGFSGGVVDNEDGSFAAQPLTAPSWFNPLELYAMGLVQPDEVEPFFLVKDPHDFDPPADPYGQSWGTGSMVFDGTVTFKGERVDVTVQDIIEANGARNDNGPFTSEFPQAFVLLTLPGTSPSTAQLEKFDRYRLAWESNFAEMTGGHGQVRTTLP